VLTSALQQKINEPIEWLLGSILLHGDDNFLFDALLQGNDKVLSHWNGMIGDFRSALKNPDMAPAKIAKEISLASGERVERDGRLRDLYAELLTVLTLKNFGYSDFEILTSRFGPTPDFAAVRNGRTVSIEVKNLREPDDIIRVVAQRRWSELRRKDPHRFNFSVRLYHMHEGGITKQAKERLQTILDQLPDRRIGCIEEILDGDIEIRIERGDVPRNPSPNFNCDVLFQSFTYTGSEPAEMHIQSAVMPEDLAFNLNDYQRFVIKLFRIAAESTRQLFSSEAQRFEQRTLAIRWEPPRSLIDMSYMGHPKQLLESFFHAVQLDVEIFILPKDTHEEMTGQHRFHAPEFREVDL
jgi:hypothetical protein